jgi:hypothetical protein
MIDGDDYTYDDLMEENKLPEVKPITCKKCRYKLDDWCVFNGKTVFDLSTACDDIKRWTIKDGVIRHDPD